MSVSPMQMIEWYQPRQRQRYIASWAKFGRQNLPLLGYRASVRSGLPTLLLMLTQKQ